MNFLIWISGSKPSSVHLLGWIAFQLGLFLLPSSAFLGGISLIVALVFGCIAIARPYWKDPWNLPFLIAAIWMVLGCFNAYSGWLAWVG